MFDRLIEFLFAKFGGSLITKVVTALATFLLTKGVMTASDTNQWIAATVQSITGLAAGCLSFYLSKKRAKSHEEAVKQALHTPVPEK